MNCFISSYLYKNTYLCKKFLYLILNKKNKGQYYFLCKTIIRHLKQEKNLAK